MNAVVTISGREAIPVRAIPYVTGWKLSPDVVAESLAQSSDWPSHPKGMVGHHIMRDGRIAEMLPKEWDSIVLELRSLSDTLHAEEVVKQASSPEWRKKSIVVLPSHCFVWRETLEHACRRAWSRLHITKERPGDKELNLTPRIPKDLVDVVFEGFSVAELDRQIAPVAFEQPATEPEPEVSCGSSDHGKQREPVAGDTSTDASGHWTERARAIADELFDHDTNLKTRDSLDGYAKRVMEKMQEGAIHGPRGRYDNHNTIKREALQGSKWWRRKPK